MENIKYLPLGFFLLFCSKLMIFKGNWEDVGILITLGCISAFYEFKSNDKKISQLENKIDTYKTEYNEKLKQLEDLKTHVAGLKLSQVRMSNSRVV